MLDQGIFFPRGKKHIFLANRYLFYFFHFLFSFLLLFKYSCLHLEQVIKEYVQRTHGQSERGVGSSMGGRDGPRHFYIILFYFSITVDILYYFTLVSGIHNCGWTII